MAAPTSIEIIPWFPRGSGARDRPRAGAARTEAVFDKIGMSAFEGTPLDTALRDCGIRTFLIAGVAIEIGIEPTVARAPTLVTFLSSWRMPAAPDEEAGQRAIAGLRYMGDAIFTTVAEVTAVLRGRSAGIGGSR